MPVCVSPGHSPLGHMWNDHLNSSVVCKTCVNSSRTISTLSGCEPASPSRIRLLVKAFPALHCQKSPISPRHLGRRNTLVNIRLVASVPLALRTDAQLPWYGNSLQTSVPCVIVAWPFDALVVELTNSYPMRLMSCSGSHSCQPCSWRTGLTWKPPVSRGFACQPGAHASPIVVWRLSE